MATLSVRLNVLPGIVRDIDITLDDLSESFNSKWELKDRLELVMKLNLESETSSHKLAPVAKIFKTIDLKALTIEQLLILENAVGNFSKDIKNIKDIIKKDD